MSSKLPPYAPKPWTYNPSSWPQRFRIALLAAAAALIALYLGLYQWRFISSVWDPFFGNGTAQVLDSTVSHDITQLIRIPDAILGVFAYLSDVVFALAGSERRWQDRPWLVVLFGIDVIPLGFVSALLVVLQGLVVQSWCFLCLITAAISLILIALSYDEVISSCLYLYKLKKKSNWTKTWWAFWGYPCEEAFIAGEEVIEKRGSRKNVG